MVGLFLLQIFYYTYKTLSKTFISRYQYLNSNYCVPNSRCLSQKTKFLNLLFLMIMDSFCFISWHKALLPDTVCRYSACLIISFCLVISFTFTSLGNLAAFGVAAVKSFIMYWIFSGGLMSFLFLLVLLGVYCNWIFYPEEFQLFMNMEYLLGFTVYGFHSPSKWLCTWTE